MREGWEKGGGGGEQEKGGGGGVFCLRFPTVTERCYQKPALHSLGMPFRSSR